MVLVEIDFSISDNHDFSFSIFFINFIIFRSNSLCLSLCLSLCVSGVTVLGVLSVLYLVLAVSCLVQLIRLRIRNPSLKWTSQKLFLLFTFLIGARTFSPFSRSPECPRGWSNPSPFFPQIVRIALFTMSQFVDSESFGFLLNFAAFTSLSDLASLLYFSSYTILILFWAEIINQAQHRPPSSIRRLRVGFLILNIAVYLLQLCLWVLLMTIGQETSNRSTISQVDNVFYGIIALGFALGFLGFGGRLFFLILHFPVESSAKGKKLTQVRPPFLLSLFSIFGGSLTSGDTAAFVFLFFFFFCYYS